MNENILKIKQLINSEVCMGTYGLVKLELREIENFVINQNSIENSKIAVKNMLTHKFVQEAKNHVGKKLDELPELKKMLDTIEIVENL